MNIIQSKWEEGYCYIADGIFYPDIFIPISYYNGNLNIGEKQSIKELINENSEMWHKIDPNPDCDLTIDNFSFFAGSTSWEGEGFVAVVNTKDNTLKWILNMSFSEGFVSLEVKENKIIAISREYPLAYKWSILLNEPESLSVEEID